MKRIYCVFATLLLLGCNSDDRPNNCNFLLDVGINYNVNLNLPQFNQLLFPVSAVRVEGQGNNGLIIVAVSSGQLRAWDGADPNHVPSSCSGLSLDGLFATCGCPDANTYEVVTGQITGENPQPCTLQEYRVEAVGNNQFIVTN
ncbi:hypothetical protein [Winogradskyella sp. A3E31]|uniref:hypothetical protein n=1 Tax=Winogradskyella sp. A3E31 TaxID=3349637 RepID=UPI00398ADE2F